MQSVLGALLLLCQVAGAIATKNPKAGIISSGTCAILNLLVLGSVLTEVQTDASGNVIQQEPVPGAAIYILGYLGMSIVNGALGGWIGGRRGAAKPFEPLARFAWVAALAVLPLLFIGGLVTSSKSGMAVPDWPNSYSANMFLFPLSRMVGGVFLEHTHRLFGSFVGLTMGTLMVWVLISEPRKWVKGLAVGLFLLVCLQGYLGGARVIQNASVLGMIHGILGQVTFGVAIALATCLSRKFKDVGTGPDAGAEYSPIAPGLAIAAWVALLIQLGLGATYRHLGQKHALWTHILFALVPAVLAMIAAFGAARGKEGTPAQRLVARIGKGMAHTTGFQLLLGGAALWAVMIYKDTVNPALPRVIVGTLHQFNGALLLAAATVVAVMALRLGKKKRTV